MRVWGRTDIGLVRSENQDAYSICEMKEYTSAVVCDGMGGTNGGRVASSLAVDVYQQEIEEKLRTGMNSQEMALAMSESVKKANEAVRQRAAENREYQQMGTTLVSAVAQKERAMLANVGDSRAYHINRSGIRQITRDHSVVENMVERGDLTPEEAKHHPRRNLITRALGPDADVQTDTFELIWKQGDFILLCSDGLVNTVSDQEILFEVIHNGEPDTCLERLLDLSKQRGAPDNVTMLLMMNI